ncbi:hypothetical protein ABIE41_003858 [Bosea sp. OAE506]|uniref:hypothetical protein n=1 Tax=Bosea sp. OAE506 TaxID=2663870 RepID=UPI00178A91E4
MSAPRREDLPDGTVRIWFATPILLHAEPKGFVDLRPPTAGEVWELGDPRAYIFNDAGLGTPYVDRPLLRQWIPRLMVGHDADILGRERDAGLGLLIEEAVLDFFANARKRSKPASEPSPKPE